MTCTNYPSDDDIINHGYIIAVYLNYTDNLGKLSSRRRMKKGYFQLFPMTPSSQAYTCIVTHANTHADRPRLYTAASQSGVEEVTPLSGPYRQLCRGIIAQRRGPAICNHPLADISPSYRQMMIERGTSKSTRDPFRHHQKGLELKTQKHHPKARNVIISDQV